MFTTQDAQIVYFNKINTIFSDDVVSIVIVGVIFNNTVWILFRSPNKEINSLRSSSVSKCSKDMILILF